MAGFLIAIISGALMSLQGAFNTNVTKASSVWVTAMFVQLTALATCAIMWVIDGCNPPFKGRGAVSFAMNVAEVLRILKLLSKYY